MIGTVRRLLRHPGELAAAWTRGVRKPYFAPFKLFLIANVIFFALAYGATGAPLVLRAIVLTIAVGAIVVGYRFVVFLVTLYTP